MSENNLAAPIIRAANPGDLAAIISLTERAYGHYLDLLGRPPVPMTEDYAPRIRAGQVWLAEDDATIVGLLVVENHADHAMIFSVAVDPARHGNGLGRGLLDFAERRAAKMGLPEMRLYTNALMTRNINLYQRLGYRETGRRPSALSPAHTIVDMAKALDGQARDDTALPSPRA